MSAPGRTLPSIDLVSREHSKHGGVVMIVTSNLSFPSRHYTQVPWCGPTAPLIATKTESGRRKTKVRFACTDGHFRGAVESSHNGFHVAFEADVWMRVKNFFSHTKLRLRENFVRLRERIARNAHLARPAATSYFAAS